MDKPIFSNSCISPRLKLEITTNIERTVLILNLEELELITLWKTMPLMVSVNIMPIVKNRPIKIGEIIPFWKGEYCRQLNTQTSYQSEKNKRAAQVL